MFMLTPKGHSHLHRIVLPPFVMHVQLSCCYVDQLHTLPHLLVPVCHIFLFHHDAHIFYSSNVSGLYQVHKPFTWWNLPNSSLQPSWWSCLVTLLPPANPLVWKVSKNPQQLFLLLFSHPSMCKLWHHLLRCLLLLGASIWLCQVSSVAQVYDILL